MTTSTATTTSVRFTQRPDHSLLLGLSATRAVTLAACVLAVAIVTVTWGMTTGVITAVGVSPMAGSALLLVEGRALIEWTPDAGRYLWRGANGRLRVLAKPGRPVPVGVLPIPGTAAQLRVFAAADGSAVLHDATADTWTAIASVTGTGFLYGDAETQDAATAGFGRALAAIGSDGQIQRIHVIHRTRAHIRNAEPETSDPLRQMCCSSMADEPDRISNLADGQTETGGEASIRSEIDSAAMTPGPRMSAGTEVHRVYAARDGNEDAQAAGAAVAAYRETLGQFRAAWRHETLLAITLGGKSSRAAIRRAGHGRTAAARVLAAHRVGLAETLDSAGTGLEEWLTPADLADWIIDGFDPASIPVHHDGPAGARRSGPGGSADRAASAGPMAVTEAWSTVRTDSAWHQVLWMAGWPRFDTHPAFLAPLILPAGATVTVSLVYEPIPTPVALRQIGRDKTAQASDAALRRRIGTLDTAEQAARETDTVQRETEIAEGHLDMRHTALIAITTATRDELADAATRIRQAAAAVGCETRILYGQQLAALNATVLPAGLQL